MHCALCAHSMCKRLPIQRVGLLLFLPPPLPLFPSVLGDWHVTWQLVEPRSNRTVNTPVGHTAIYVQFRHQHWRSQPDDCWTENETKKKWDDHLPEAKPEKSPTLVVSGNCMPLQAGIQCWILPKTNYEHTHTAQRWNFSFVFPRLWLKATVAPTDIRLFSVEFPICQFQSSLYDTMAKMRISSLADQGSHFDHAISSHIRFLRKNWSREKKTRSVHRWLTSTAWLGNSIRWWHEISVLFSLIANSLPLLFSGWILVKNSDQWTRWWFEVWWRKSENFESFV